MEWWKKFIAWLTANPPPADWLTAGPDEDEHPIVPGTEVIKSNWGQRADHGLAAWTNGWYRFATRVDAHPGRVGPRIVPQAVVVHTTDCLPGTAPVIIKSWSTTPGKRNGAHFVIGRDGSVTQLVSVTHNGEHAGGPTHGWFQLDPGHGGLIHPNTCTVGIELDCAGKLAAPRTPGGNPVHRDSGKEVPRADCAQHKDGTWWHGITGAQETALRWLLEDLKAVLAPFPKNTMIVTGGPAERTGYGRNGVPWAMRGGQFVGHVTLDPINKTDPGPFVMAKLLEWGL